MIDDREYFVNSQKDLKEAISIISYGLSYLVPCIPTYHLVNELLKPKKKRSKAVIRAGIGGTVILLTTKVLPLTGIIALNQFDYFGLFDEKENPQELMEEETSKKTLEKTILFEDAVKNKKDPKQPLKTKHL